MTRRNTIKACAALLLAFGVMLMALAPKAESAVPDKDVAGLAPEAGAMALIELESGEMLAGKNEDTELPMASTTKIMTALVVLENCDTEELVSIPDEAVGTEGSSVYLQKGESMIVKDLLYGLMLASGNDAAVALAVHAGGSVSGFVDMMNARAEKMGLEHTAFVNPNGLHAAGHRTTALELCRIAAEAMKNEEFREIVSTKYYRCESGSIERTFKNKNSLLWDYEGALGVKTGYTMAAGRCLVFAAEREGMTLIGAVLNCRPMFETAKELLDSAFDTFAVERIIGKGEAVTKAFVENGVKNVLEVCAKESIIVVMKKDEGRSFRTAVRLRPELKAPVEAGEKVGVLTVYEGEAVIWHTDLIAACSVRERDFCFWWKLLTRCFIL